MSRIKVLEVIEAAGGGALHHVEQIARHLDPDEFDLTVALSTRRMLDPGPALARIRRFGARVEIVPMVRRVAPLSDAACLLRLVRLIRTGRYDVVHAHSSKAGFLARAAARLAGVRRVFYTPHAFAFLKGGMAGWCYRQLERIGGAFGGTILAVSESERAAAVENRLAPPDRVLVVRNAVEPPEEPTPAERSQARAALGLPQDADVVGTLGRLTPQKGCEYLVRAAPRVLRERGSARFVLIGSGGLEGRLRRLAGELGVAGECIFAGHLDDADGLLAAFDVYVQPSLWEGLPYALLEAMGRGLPVVASEAPGNVDVVRHGVTGVLVKPKDPGALADAVLALLGNAGRRRELGLAARKLVLRDYRLDDFISATAALYRGS